MRRYATRALGLTALILAGCDYRMMDPRWKSLADQGVSSVPGEYHLAIFVRGATDAQFAAAVPDLKKVTIRELNFQDTQLTDQSIGALLQLRDLERLYLTQTDFTIDGLVRLAALPRLKYISVPEGQFTPDEIRRLRDALPNTDVMESRLGAWRFQNPGGSSTSQPAQ